jgi:hypothetical protein
MNTDVSMDFMLLSFLLACASLYCIKKNKYNVIDTLYIFILTCFYYLILITLDNFQVNEHFQVSSGSHVPMLLENEEHENDDDVPNFPKPLPPSERKHPSKHTSEKTHLDRHAITPVSEKTHLDKHAITPVSEKTHLDKHAVEKHGDKRPNTHGYIFRNPVSITPINIKIDIDEKDSPVDRYRRIPRRRRDVENRQFDNGFYDDRINRLERQINNLENRPIERQIVRETPRRDPVPYFEKRRKCPVCPVVLEKPWSEWMDSKDQRSEYVRRDRRRYPKGDHNNRKWSDERAGNNPLPLLPLLPLLP